MPGFSLIASFHPHSLYSRSPSSNPPLTDSWWPLAHLKIPSLFGLIWTSQHHPHLAISTIFSLLAHLHSFNMTVQAIPHGPSYQTCKSLMQKLSINICFAPAMTWHHIHYRPAMICQQMTTLIPYCEFRWNVEWLQIILNHIFRFKHDPPPCPSPDFLKSLNTSHSAYNIPIVSKLIANSEADIPMWKLCHKPSIKLEQGLFVQGCFGQGVILELSHTDKNFHYFICHTFNNGPVFLIVQNRWHRGWWGEFLSRCTSLWSCVWL